MRRETNIFGDRPLRKIADEDLDGDQKKVTDPFALTKGSAGSYGREDGKPSSDDGAVLHSDIKLGLPDEEEAAEQQSKSQ